MAGEGAPRREGRASGFVAPRAHEWLLVVAGALLVVRYRWLLDDAFVYFRYVDNLLFTGAGLVFNAGEYVEGYSSPLQCLVLVLLRAAGLDWMHAVTLLGVTCFVGFALLVVKLNRELSPDAPVVDLPLAYLACLYGTTSFFTSGLETPLAHSMAPVTALWLVRSRGAGLTALLALAPLARPELVLAVGGVGLFRWWRDGRFPWRLFVSTALAVGFWLAFRVVYYAELLPNTFYLKDDVQVAQGLVYLWDLLRGTAALPVATVACIVFALGRLRRQADGPEAPPQPTGDAAARAAMLLIAAAVAAYVVRIGGAALHYWYLAFPFTLAVCASAGWMETAAQRLGASQRGVAAAALALAAVVALAYPHQLSGHPFRRSESHTQIGVIGDASFHRLHPRLQPASWRGRVRPRDMRAFARVLAQRGYDRVVTGTWCRAHWAGYRDRVVHGFGLTEPVLARVDTPELKPGHKPALRALAEDVAAVRRTGSTLVQAIDRGDAPAWMARNRESIATIEAKMFNRHRPVENLRLAFTFPERIVLR
ncbi:MAG: hypothetical protein ACQGVC_08690 [Myxococcota bacterium]